MFKRFSFKKLFRFPGPKDLGMSDNNCAMPSSLFPPEDGRKTWEDYYEALKEMFPIRYFLGISLVKFIRYEIYLPIKRPISNAIYWLKCHTLPSYKFHLIDIRQPISNIDNIDNYRYGYREVSDRMLLACFTLLNTFVEKEQGGYRPTETEIEEADEFCKETLIEQRDLSIEMMAIYNWWKYDRKWDHKLVQDAINEWYNYRKLSPKSSETKRLYDRSRYLEDLFHNKEDEMLIRLMKIRNKLWT